MSFDDFLPPVTSDSTTFTLTTEEIIKNAFDIIQVGTDGEAVEPEYYERARDTLNLVMRELQAQGLHITSYRTGTLFLVGSQVKYVIEDSNSTNEFFQTEIALDAAIAQTFIQVVDATDMTVSDFIGIIQGDTKKERTRYHIQNIVGHMHGANRPGCQCSKVCKPRCTFYALKDTLIVSIDITINDIFT